MKTEDTETLLETTDPTKVVELNSRRPKNHGKRAPNKGGQMTENKYKRIMRETMADEISKRVADLTEAEEEFVDLVVGGSSPSAALLLTHPERCIGKDGKQLSSEQLWDRGHKLLNTVRVRAKMRHLLEQEMEDASHTSLAIHNFVQKRLLIEAQTAPPAQRLAALKLLAERGMVAEREREQTQHVKSPDQVLNDLEAEVIKLTT